MGVVRDGNNDDDDDDDEDEAEDEAEDNEILIHPDSIDTPCHFVLGERTDPLEVLACCYFTSHALLRNATELRF